MAAKQTEQFFDFDVAKYLGDFKVPGVDVETIVANQRKNIEALTQANKLAFEGLQNVVKRQVEILRQTMDEVAQVSKQAEFAKEAFERALSNARELAEMIAKANSEAFDLLNKRFTQSLDEARDLITKAGKK
jgi:hypothetical protein